MVHNEGFSAKLVLGEMLTIHSVIKNEPFVYYAIKAVYPYADTILLYDTGSDDKYTLADIGQLISEDKQGKIIFKQVETDCDETYYAFKDVKELVKQRKGLKGRGAVRQQQIDDTKTEFFMLVDGDEVHYQDTMRVIVSEVLTGFPQDKIACFLPETWHADLTQIIHPPYRYTGRIFRTDRVGVICQSPDERHCDKTTGRAISRHDKSSFIAYVKPFAHFSVYIKPFRMDISHPRHLDYKELPEVMLSNDCFIYRYMKYRKDNSCQKE
ncbi:MAG: hypothetical protein KKB38_20205 [Gammaproteobacteria bacterium]|nr:hypothetical protein [Gammaproteobacteria bacterium]